jgi:RNA polymerase sigma factor (sigma-70 family)
LSSAASLGKVRSLAERIHQGDSTAETELVHTFSHRIFLMGVARMHDREAARELVQDVLVAVIGSLRKGQLQDPDKLLAFVHGTARNVINNQLRSQSQRPRLEPLPEDLPQTGFTEQLEEAERVRLVREALDQLVTKDRRILWMTLVEGRKPGEIAAALGLGCEVVRTRKVRAIRKISDLIRKKVVTKSGKFAT